MLVLEGLVPVLRVEGAAPAETGPSVEEAIRANRLAGAAVGAPPHPVSPSEGAVYDGNLARARAALGERDSRN